MNFASWLRRLHNDVLLGYELTSGNGELAVSTPEGFDAMLALIGMARGKKAMLSEQTLSEEEEEGEEDYIKEREKTGIRRVENCTEAEEETEGRSRAGKEMTQDNNGVPEVESSSSSAHVALGVENNSIRNRKGGIGEPGAATYSSVGTEERNYQAIPYLMDSEEDGEFTTVTTSKRTMGFTKSSTGQATPDSKQIIVPAPPRGDKRGDMSDFSRINTASGVAPLPVPLSACAFAHEIELLRRGLDTTQSGDNENPEKQLDTARRLRQLFSTNQESLVQEVLDRGWIPCLLKWLAVDQNPSVQVEALWALTNIAVSTSDHAHSHVLIKHGAIPVLVQLLTSDNDVVLEQAMWVLGNLAGEGAVTRDAILSAGTLSHLVNCLESNSWLSLQRIGSWTLSNLFDGQPRPHIDISLVLIKLCKLLTSSDSEVLSHTCWALSHLCDGPSAHIKAIVEAGTCWRLVELLMHRSWCVAKPALRAIGNIVCAEDDTDYTKFIIEAGAVERLRQLIGHSMKDICKEACWTLSNIAAGTFDQIQTVLDSGVMPQIFQLANSPDTDLEVRSEAHWVVLNATSCGSDSQIEYLVLQGCVPILSDLLTENSMVMMALEGLERVLQVGETDAQRLSHGGSNPYAQMTSSERIKQLEKHKSSAIAKRASRVWKSHFETCAICELSFNRHSPDTKFCCECRSVVCSSCDCSVFHLSYQEELWDKLEGKETSEKKAKTAAKKSKKAKRKAKAKAKEKKASQDMSQDMDELLSDRLDMVNNRRKTPPFQAAQEAGIDQHSALEHDHHPNSGQHSNSRTLLVGGPEDPEAYRNTIIPDLCNHLSVSAILKKNVTPQMENGTRETGVADNDDLVTYLEQTGSILALAQRLAEEDEVEEL